jgi:hypothetical protein
MTEYDDNELWREAFVEAGAQTLADLRLEWSALKKQMQDQATIDLDALLAPLKERIARLEGEVATLTTMLGSDSGRAKAKQLRPPRDNGHRLEAPRQ